MADLVINIESGNLRMPVSIDFTTNSQARATERALVLLSAKFPGSIIRGTTLTVPTPEDIERASDLLGASYVEAQTIGD